MRRILRLRWYARKAARLGGTGLSRLVPPGAARLNVLAACLSLTAFSVIVLNFQSTPAGAGAGPSARMLISSGAHLALSGMPTTAANPLIPSGDTQIKVEELNKKIQDAVRGSRIALQYHIALLELGKMRLSTMPDYTATFIKQERVDGDLQDLQTCELKLRHQPFSVYLKWLEGGDVGQEALFAEGQNNDQLVVHLGGKKGKLLPDLKLDPKGKLALRESRHPITEMGLLQLSQALLKYRKRDLTLTEGVRFEMISDQKFAGRDCYCFIVDYSDRSIDDTYRKSVTYIDQEYSLPVCVRNYGWPESGAEIALEKLDEETLIEHYGYLAVKFDRRLVDLDFDRTNEGYKFRR